MENSVIKFSFIVPVYNCIKYLPECLNSLIVQNYSDFEIILVDDGSNDGSSEYCKNVSEAHNNVNYINIGHKGLPAARNIGIKNASGEWIIFVDSDDFIDSKTYLSEISKHIMDADVVTFGYKLYSDKSKKIVSSFNFIDIDNNIINNTLETITRFNKSLQYYPYVWLHPFRKDFLLEKKIYWNENIFVGEDLEWTYKLFLANPTISVFSNNDYNYRIFQDRIVDDDEWKKGYTLVKTCSDLLGQFSGEIKEELLNDLAYRLCSLVLFIATKTNKQHRKYAFDAVSEFSYLLNYGSNILVVISCRILKLLGFRKGSLLLNFLNKLRHPLIYKDTK